MTNARIARDRRAAALIEFAVLLPVFACMLYGLIGYGQYFLLAHSVQQVANDAARATVAGLTPDERRTIAAATVSAEIARLPEIRANALTVAVTEAAPLVTVRLTLDASSVPLLRNGLVPAPDTMIDRRAVARTGGIQ